MKTTTKRKENKLVYHFITALCKMALETRNDLVTFRESGENAFTLKLFQLIWCW